MQINGHLEEIEELKCKIQKYYWTKFYSCCIKTNKRKVNYRAYTYRLDTLVTLKPERKFYEKIRKRITNISWIRLENNSLHGTPDLLGYNNSGTFFTVELKVTKGNKVRFSPHQIAFHVRHPHNTFICIQHLGSGTVKLFRGSQILELAACGLELDACCLSLDACGLLFDSLGA